MATFVDLGIRIINRTEIFPIFTDHIKYKTTIENKSNESTFIIKEELPKYS